MSKLNNRCQLVLAYTLLCSGFVSAEGLPYSSPKNKFDVEKISSGSGLHRNQIASVYGTPSNLEISVLDSRAIESISMHVGLTVLLKADKVTRVSIGNGSVIDAKEIDENQVLINALDAGDTTLMLWYKNGGVRSIPVRVDIVNTSRIESEISLMASKFPGIKTTKIGDKIYIDPEEMDPLLMERLTTFIKNIPQAVILPTSHRVLEVPIVEIEAKIIAFNRNATDQLGVRWGATADGLNFGVVSDLASGQNSFRVLPKNSPFDSGVNEAINGTINNISGRPRVGFGMASVLSSQIDLLVQRGDAVIIANPNLTTRSGAEAQFLAGGEFPLPGVGAFGGSISFKPYGIRLNIKPNADRSGMIRGSILAEISSIDMAVAVQGIPGLLIRRTDSEFNLQSGTTMVLSGLLSRESSRTEDGLPGLRKIPLLGSLFKSNSVIEKDMDVVVLLTPRLVTPNSSSSRANEAQERAKQYSREGQQLLDETVKLRPSLELSR